MKKQKYFVIICFIFNIRNLLASNILNRQKKYFKWGLCACCLIDEQEYTTQHTPNIKSNKSITLQQNKSESRDTIEETPITIIRNTDINEESNRGLNVVNQVNSLLFIEHARELIGINNQNILITPQIMQLQQQPSSSHSGAQSNPQSQNLSLQRSYNSDYEQVHLKEKTADTQPTTEAINDAKNFVIMFNKQKKMEKFENETSKDDDSRNDDFVLFTNN